MYEDGLGCQLRGGYIDQIKYYHGIIRMSPEKIVLHINGGYIMCYHHISGLDPDIAIIHGN